MDNKRVAIVYNEDTKPEQELLLILCRKKFDKMDVKPIHNIEFFLGYLPQDDLTKVVFYCISDDLRVSAIRETRKDIFLVGFSGSIGLSKDEQYIRALGLCKAAHCNLVMATDYKTGWNMVVTPEEARYPKPDGGSIGTFTAFGELVDIAKLRSHLTFTRSTVIAGKPIPWNSEEVPSSLREVVNYCIFHGAYKPFAGSTAGHFAVKVDDNTFLTSIRKTNFNKLSEVGLVKVVTDGPDTVLAYGAKPSVGGQSQRIVFKDHEGMDCIIHMHVPMKPDSQVPVVNQREFECGSHECGKNCSDGLKQFGNLKAVFLDEHGPNIIFNRNIDPNEVIKFIDDNFDLSQKTGGFVSMGKTPNTFETAKELL